MGPTGVLPEKGYFFVLLITVYEYSCTMHMGGICYQNYRVREAHSYNCEHSYAEVKLQNYYSSHTHFHHSQFALEMFICTMTRLIANGQAVSPWLEQLYLNILYLNYNHAALSISL